MKRNSKLFKATRNFYQKLCSSSPSTIKEQSLWLLRAFLVTRKQPEWVNAGFVLPTVAMVALVVVLLTTAILFRSFERSKNASNVRVNQAVLNAASPAIDRARAKLDALFDDPTLPRGTPSDSVLYDAIKKDKYRLGDEVRLKLGQELDSTSGVQHPDDNTPLDKDETLKSAWKFPVDTDGNGKYDSYTLYGIYFRTPGKDSTTGDFSRGRKPLDARTPPMDNDTGNQQCKNAAGFSSLVGNSSWYKLQSGNLGKSFFVYTVNVPITQSELQSLPSSADSSNSSIPYQGNSEIYKGNKGFVALEFQQDRSRIPLAYHAVWYENDLEIITGATALKLNGRIHTNSNLLVGVTENKGSMAFRQVSSKVSCFYNQENGLITVGGNVGNGSLAQTSSKAVTIDLYQGFEKNIKTDDVDNNNKSTGSTGGSQIGFNDAAYNQRIAEMKKAALNLCATCKNASDGKALKEAVDAASYYSEEIKSAVKAKVKDAADTTTAYGIFSDEMEIYLRNRTRRVPFAEVSDPTGAGAINIPLGINTSSVIEPPQDWREPVDTSTNQLKNTNPAVTLSTSQLEATFPTLQKKEGIQTKLGDRIFVGNNLPARWKKGGKYVGSDEPQFINNVNWTRPTGADAQQRWRNTQVQALADLGLSERNGFWEQKATEVPQNPLDGVGGVRIVTGAGIYVDGAAAGAFYPRNTSSFLPAPPIGDVWTDAMPMTSPDPAKANLKGDLLMRATAVYHYKKYSGLDQQPIACVSSYYDPSYKYLKDINKNGIIESNENFDSTLNRIGGPANVSTGLAAGHVNGRSNNGIVYDFPGRSTFGANKARLEKQKNLKFPNGRLVNQPLKDALDKIGGGLTVPNNLQPADYSAIDTALCAISILNDETDDVLNAYSAATTDMPPHGAIKESSFLDGREIRQVSVSSSPTNYNLDLEQRQPQEIRVTDINLGVLASTKISGSSEYLLPYSGIIYASRDDGLRDQSDKTDESELLSPTDFQLDPTRRPNGIRLLNGSTLARDPSNNKNQYEAKEKGLILVSNLPAYIKGKFNLHRTSTTATTEIEEFQEVESSSVNFYARSTPEKRFACRPGRAGCPTGEGDYWRPATIIADTMTLLSEAFKDGVRSESDYDLNNNTGIAVETNLSLANPANFATGFALLSPIRKERLKMGFWENNFATNTDWWQTSGSDKNFPKTTLGSYALNGITPIQRRVENAPLYVMEICRKELVEQCTVNDWVVGFDIDGDGVLSTTSQNYPLAGGGNATLTERDIKAYQLGQAILAARGSSPSNPDSNNDKILTTNTPNEINWNTAFIKLGVPFIPSNNKSIRQRLGSGDTGDTSNSIDVVDRRYPRRVAFARDSAGILITAGGLYRPMGVGCPLDITGSAYDKNGCTYGGTTSGTNIGISGDSALWFRTTSVSSNPSAIANATYTNNNPLFYFPPTDPDGQPLLVPVLQIHDANSKPSASLRSDGTDQENFRAKWQQIPDTDTVFNATYVVGNSPSRADEVSAGLQNFVRFLENWKEKTVKISGSFIQLKRSIFATAPLAPIFTVKQTTKADDTPANNLSVFDYNYDTYPTPNVDGISPFYSAPDRNWGFDVGLLSEQPDLFAQRFTLPSAGRPNEFFREVSQDDDWVKALLCAGQASDKKGEKGATYSRAVPKEYFPSSCPVIPQEPNT